MEADHTTRVPVKDLSCVGEVAALQHLDGLTWADVKKMLNSRSARVSDDPRMMAVVAEIQKKESDDCVLGIISTSAYMTPAYYPKHRNLARILGTDVNLLSVNVSFYEALRAGFPIFSLFDDMSTPEFRAWFHTPECVQILDSFRDRPACSAAAAQSLRKRLEEERNAGLISGHGRRLMLTAIEIFDTEACECRPANAAASLVLALCRAQALLEAPTLRSEREDSAVNRDVIELVTRAEELIKDYSWDEGFVFGRLVGSPWNFWWLLKLLQEAMEQIFPMMM
ncbi:unnamed protein product [Symbiodinium natans]|uniref:Uncharacterized protein n=1 Tax=Symbiodinium natans TaxID=878477 RepID=A0A812IIH7_9DINO|nr:unnamed protein product [Symbiodinium natans]